MREKEWQDEIVELAGYYGWRVFHPYDMRRSEPGWPDLTLVRPGELVFAELKTDKGRRTPAQIEWGFLLASVAEMSNGVLEYHVWRPRDFHAVHDRLKRHVSGT
jgi:hypothetical protein